MYERKKAMYNTIVSLTKSDCFLRKSHQVTVAMERPAKPAFCEEGEK